MHAVHVVLLTPQHVHPVSEGLLLKEGLLVLFVMQQLLHDGSFHPLGFAYCLVISP